MRRAVVRALGLPVLALSALLVPGSAQAQAEPGSGFASLSLSAVGAGQSFLFTASDQLPADFSLPYAAADLHLGAGTATSSIAWPGEVGASIGSAAVVLGAPPQAEALNDPLVARARTGSGPPDVHNGSLPGSTMDAHATPADLRAVTRTSLAESVASVAGSTAATAHLALTGVAAATADATSSVRDVTVGVVHVATVFSRATGTTDGRHADARGSTVVTGLTVAGTPVTVDDQGLHLAGTAVPAAQARDAVEAALAKAGMTLQLGQPTKVARGGRVEYATGSLVLTTPLGVLSLGGAQLRLAATTSDPLLPPVVTGTMPGGAAATGSTPPAAEVTPLGSTSRPATVTSGPLPDLVRSVLQALRPLGVTTGYGWWWLPTGVLLALLSGTFLRRVPGAVLPSAPLPCPTEDQQ